MILFWLVEQIFRLFFIHIFENATMEAKLQPVDFFVISLDVLVDLLGTTDRATIVNFSSACKQHKHEFDKEDGLWKRLTLNIFGWTIQGNINKLRYYFKRSIYFVKVTNFN